MTEGWNGDREIGLDVSESEQAATVCGSGPTVKGIDISKYQGDINWPAVANDGVEFAFVRVSDGLNAIDAKFARNWDGTRANHVLRGAYQFFRPGQDARAQADLFLSKIGTLEADDLPPVIDVEAADGLSASKVAAGVKTWIDRVASVTGRTPIIYTGYYFWRDSVGAADQTTSPLWHAQYSTASCPNIAPPWKDWAIWQYSSSGSVAGIVGNVDMNRFNGTRAELEATLMAAPRACGTIPRVGGIVDDGDACFMAGGPLQYIRQVTDGGDGGDLQWTHATANATESNYGEWNLA
ncbi:MAG: GH25 family lysozyme, partial [Proteobacteria bacterium]|nr:GH25 family lysozyme [Pseudomonadota bacterium]